MKDVEFQGRTFAVKDSVRFITQDRQGLIVAHVKKPVEREYDYGSPVWVSDDRAEELYFPSTICQELKT